MDLPQRIAVPDKRPDAIRAWAEMEGRSPLMSEDLYLRHRARRRHQVSRRARRRDAARILRGGGRGLAVAIELWRLWSSR